MKSNLLMAAWLIGWTVGSPASAGGGEISVHLSGTLEFPGILRLQGERERIDHLCFLGENAHGNVDAVFLESLSPSAIPEGNYRISPALPEERWPDRAFTQDGALRFVPLPGGAQKKLRALQKHGLAVHGRDFFPLAERMTRRPRMVRFFSRQLFENLARKWGALRISNWDMGRLHDFYQKNVHLPDRWTVTVVAANPKRIQKLCEPLKVRRKPGGPPE